MRALEIIDRHSQGAPSTIRCIKTAVATTVSGVTHRVREHPAPSGALRLRNNEDSRALVGRSVREHPAPSGALRPEHADVGVELASSQGAPSTIRCIKTPSPWRPRRWPMWWVREHPAPSGALRRDAREVLRDLGQSVKEHPAPPGALRPGVSHPPLSYFAAVREHPAPPGALRPPPCTSPIRPCPCSVGEHPAPPGALRP